MEHIMDWSKINDTIFEEIACAYANDVYDKYTWVPTGKSWDGNKDAFFSDKIESINYLYKGWCEAKYTQNPQSSIPKSHMDSTLVSGILDGKVIFILFITNGKITTDFIQRATAILKPHKINIKFVEGTVLTDWIKNNDKIRDKYFESIVWNESSQSLELEVKDVCIFNAIMSAPSLITPILKLKVDKEYFFYINLYSNQQKTVNIELNNNALKKIPLLHEEYEVSPGYNSFLIRYLAKYPFNGKVQISIFIDEEIVLHQEILDLLIEEDDLIPIVYTQQQTTLMELHNCINGTFTDNMLLHIYGSGGNGKSFLIQQLMENISFKYNQILLVKFSEKEAENACSLCKIILFVNFGFLYDLSEEAFFTLLKDYTNFSTDIFVELREGTKDQITALNIVQKIITLLQTNAYSLFPNANNMIRRNASFIILDDIQKVHDNHSFLCKEIINEFVEKSFSQILIACNRPNEFYDTELEQIIKEKRVGKWELTGISVPDIHSSICNNFNQDIAKLINLFPSPVSVLHLELLIKNLNKKNIIRAPKEKKGAIFSDAYNETNTLNHQFAVDKVRKCKYLNILYIVYKIESGVPITLLQEFYNNQYIIASKSFFQDSLIKEESAILKPFHDIYLYAFQQIDFNNSYMEELNQFLQFCIKKEINNHVLLSNMLSILIEKNNVLRVNYLEQARKICADYYSKSEYIAAKNLALTLLPDLDTTSYSAYTFKDLELLYIFAQSEKYSKTHVGSTRYLQLIADIGEVIPLNSIEKGVVQEVHSELITNYLYCIDYSNFETELKYFENNLKGKTEINSSEHKVNAYLNFLNRKILYKFFLGSPDLEEAYKEANSESIRLIRDDYQAYSDMDYAKILLYSDKKRALELLKISLPVFEKYAKCEKRKIDCKAEIVFVEYLLHNNSYDELYILQKNAYDNKFMHVYARITLILLTLELIDSENTNNIEARLTKLLIEYNDLNGTNRLGLFTNQLFTAIYYKEGNYQKQCVYAKKQQMIAEKLSKEYLEVPLHNQLRLESNKIVWKYKGKQTDDNGLWLDPKIW